MPAIPRCSAILGLAIGLVGCSGMNRGQQRALSGGAIGAAGGAAIGAMTGGSLVGGALLGGAGGAAVGALARRTAPAEPPAQAVPPGASRG